LGSAAQESSNAWNNAGTGHAALCELNYTPEQSDGSIDISKALQVNTEFDLSRQFWSYLVKKGAIKDPQSFLHPVPHMSFVGRSRESRLSQETLCRALGSSPLPRHGSWVGSPIPHCRKYLSPATQIRATILRCKTGPLERPDKGELS
jgi:hypothetical protein